jgi:hypothetical protein
VVKNLLVEKLPQQPQQRKQVLAVLKPLQVKEEDLLKHHRVADHLQSLVDLLKHHQVADLQRSLVDLLKHHQAADHLQSREGLLKHHQVADLQKSLVDLLKHHRVEAPLKKEIYLRLLSYLLVEEEKEEKEEKVADLLKHLQSQGHSQNDPQDLRVVEADLLKHLVHSPLEGEKKRLRRQVAV